MPVDTGGARALPPELVASLRQAFARELEERLPALQAALSQTDDPRPERLGDARRAAHSIASSAYVVGEPDLALLARDLEARLDAGGRWREQAGELIGALRRWTA